MNLLPFKLIYVGGLVASAALVVFAMFALSFGPDAVVWLLFVSLGGIASQLVGITMSMFSR